MRGKLTLLAGVCAGAIAFPAFAQDQSAAAAADDATDGTEIIVTAQRTNQKLQDVPIAISAFNSEALERQQIKNTSDLQLTLPNVTFTKGNFTGASFTIRGIGDLCVGVTCDSATAIHMNDAPLFGTRLFESEFYDMAQIEVLRGPQGTLFGRNATSGVINFRTQRPKLGNTEVAAEVEYGNYNSMKTKGMLNVPIGEIAAVRVAGFYLNRDGYTTNIYDNTKHDDRNMFGLRGSLRIEPSSGTTIDFMVQYFHEKDKRARIQKQMCQRDPTGVLGCLAGSRLFQTTNANSTFVGVLTSKEFLTTQLGAGLGNAFAFGSIYGPDAYTGVVNPADYRTVNTDNTPQYYTREWIAQGQIDQDLGSGLSLKLEGNYQNVVVDSSQDYNISIQNRALLTPALTTLQGAALASIIGPGTAPYFLPLYNALTPGGPNGPLCTSLAEETGTGAFGGHRLCSATPQDFDRSNQNQSSWTAEAILSSKWDGKFNFLVGGIYGKFHLTESSYYVDTFGIDYFSGLFGSFTSLGTGKPPSYLGTPTYRNNSPDLRISTYGLFGEAYFKFNDQLKLTLGLRYNHDQKDIRARVTLANFLVPYSSTNAYATPFGAGYDADPATVCPTTNPATLSQANGIVGPIGSVAGCEAFQVRKVTFGEFTGRAVLDYAITPDNLIYASFSRGYKSGGINPPLSPVFTVPEGFKPEFVNAFEIGSKNQFGKMTLNFTAFYYDYKDLQLSRIVARTSVNDNVSAKIYGAEAEMIYRPTPEITMNIGASYLHTEVAQDKFLANPRDFGGGRADAVIIKDITNGANCAVASNSGSAVGVNGFVNQTNAIINSGAIPGLLAGAGLKPTTAFPAGGGIASTGAFSVCGVLSALAGSVGPAFGGVTVFSAGIPVNIKGNKLPGAPDYKFSAGLQYAAPVGELTVTPRVDYVYTGKSTGNIFNGVVNEVPSFSQINAQMQIDGAGKKWFARAWIQNITNNDAITGLYVTDQSSGNYTNIFTLEPRRYGVTAGVKF